MVILIRYETGEIMRFEYYMLGNRWVLKTYKNQWCTRARILHKEELDKIVENIKINGWAVREKQVMEV